MKLAKLILFLILIANQKAVGQKYALYSNDTLTWSSDYLNEAITLNLHLPETFNFSSKQTKYPVTIIFDSQHERTYPHIINTFDLLTSETQIPESIIIGIPFNIKNRYYLTSNQTHDNDSLSGIERMEMFIFKALIPKLKETYKANDFITLIGHSRTAFLVNYLTFKRSRQINNAFALSGFFDNSFLSIDTFLSFLTEASHFPNKLNYYHTTGTVLEETPYSIQNRRLDSLLSNKKLPKNLNVTFKEHSNANHMSNYWVSVPSLLINAFAAYNAILDTWFHEKLESGHLNSPVEAFKLDLSNAGQSTGTELNPNLTHIYSLASYYANTEHAYTTAIDFYNLGLEYYPEYLDFYVNIIECYGLLKDVENVNKYKSILKKKVQMSKHLNKSEKDEYIEYTKQ